MILGLAFGLFRGRKWCDWYCPRGSFFDAYIKNISPQKKIPLLFKDIRFRVFVLILLLLLMGANLLARYPQLDKIGLFFVILLTSTTLLGIALAVIFHQRSWCMVCPIGTLINLTGKNKNPLKIDPRLCIDCKLCASACPVQIKPHVFKGVKDGIIKDADCLKCASCIYACSKGALSFKK